MSRLTRHMDDVLVTVHFDKILAVADRDDAGTDAQGTPQPARPFHGSEVAEVGEPPL